MRRNENDEDSFCVSSLGEAVDHQDLRVELFWDVFFGVGEAWCDIETGMVSGSQTHSLK